MHDNLQSLFASRPAQNACLAFIADHGESDSHGIGRQQVELEFTFCRGHGNLSLTGHVNTGKLYRVHVLVNHFSYKREFLCKRNDRLREQQYYNK